jgi:hypothetical protein
MKLKKTKYTYKIHGNNYSHTSNNQEMRVIQADGYSKCSPTLNKFNNRKLIVDSRRLRAAPNEFNPYKQKIVKPDAKS